MNQNTQAAQGVKPAAPTQQTALSNTTPPQKVSPPTGQKKSLGRKHAGILFFGRSQLFIFVEGTSSIAAYPYPHDVIRDLDVVNKDLLIQQVTTLIQKNQLPPASFYAVFANPTIFARQLLSTDPSQKKIEEENFMNTVPFEEVSARHVTMGGKMYVVAANKHFYESVADAFEQNGSEITLVLPEFLFAKDVNLTQGLQTNTAMTLLHRMPAFKEYNFIQKEVPAQSSSDLTPPEEKKLKLQVTGGKSNRTFVIGGSATMLIGVLFAGFLLMQQNNTQQTTHVLQQGRTPNAVPTVAPEPQATTSGQVASPSGNVQGATSPSIVISYQQQQAFLANQVRARLAQIGYTAVTLQNTSVVAARPTIVFNNYLSQPLRDVISDTVRGVVGNTAVYETKDASSDVVITLSTMR